MDAQIAASGAQFAVSTGDVAYPGGTQATYGDLNQTGVNVSAVFGPSYWAVPGESIPYFAISGNHGLNSNFITNWPESATAAASGGEYGMYPYPSIDGASAASYPTSYYAFSSRGRPVLHARRGLGRLEHRLRDRWHLRLALRDVPGRS